MQNSKNIVLGCDVSKDKIDIFAMEKATGEVITAMQISNNRKGFMKLVKKYKNSLDKLYVVLEATGNYHMKFVDFLVNREISLSIVNPLKIKRFAQMKMIRIKTDKADARIIALYGLEQNPKDYQKPTEAQKQLKSLRTVRNNLMKQRTMNRNLLHSQELVSLSSEAARKSIRKVIKRISEEIKKIDKEIESIVKEHYRETYELLQTIKGIGTLTASAIIAYLGNLESFETSKQVASFIGITPKIRQSGKMDKTSGITKQGNKRLRTLLYLGALSAARSNRTCKELYKRMLSKGKQKKTALIAVSNKLVRQIFAVVKNKTAFDDNYGLAVN